MDPSEHNWELAERQEWPPGHSHKIDARVWQCTRCKTLELDLRNRPPPYHGVDCDKAVVQYVHDS